MVRVYCHTNKRENSLAVEAESRMGLLSSDLFKKTCNVLFKLVTFVEKLNKEEILIFDILCR